MHVAGFNLVSVSLNFQFCQCQTQLSVSVSISYFVSGFTDIDSKLLLRYPYLSLSYGTSAASLSESSCLLHESRTNIIVIMTLRSPVESAHDSASRVGVRERLDLASAPASRRRARLSLEHMTAQVA